MNEKSGRLRGFSRRNFVRSTLIAAGGAAMEMVVTREPVAAREVALAAAPADSASFEPFWGEHQSGITTPAQRHIYFIAFDLTTNRRSDAVDVLRAWTLAAARMTAGQTAQPVADGLKPAVPQNGGAAKSSGADYGVADQQAMGADTGEVLDSSPARLTVTFGFGPGLFTKDGKDRYGLAARRPAALVDLPAFAGDQLVPAQTGGDLSIQACADDPQVAFHAVRQLARIAQGATQIRWVQAGFLPNGNGRETSRYLMGFKDGTIKPDPQAVQTAVWVGNEGQGWMSGGSYLVARRIRIALEHWDRMQVAFQEQTIGRHKVSGAPLGGRNESDPLDLKAVDKDGNPVIPENAHVRLAAPESNDGAQMLRRGYSYNDGVSMTAERWPPWRQALEYDAGLLFLAYQRDPRTAFIKMFERMSKFDMLNQFATHVGGGLFACPRGMAKGEFVGQRLFERS